MKLILSVLALSLTASAFASYKDGKSLGVYVCSGADNISITLNAKRTTMKYMVEGESNGPEKIFTTRDNGHDTVTFVSKDVTLTLSDKGDKFLYHGDQEWSNCE